MALPIQAPPSLTDAWEVLMLFVIPIGGGIPGGVLLARDRGIAWPEMMVLYFISDLLLACVFEPLMLFVIAASKRSQALVRVIDFLKASTRKTLSAYGPHLGPFTLILVAFGVDPMTGRAAALSAGYGFFKGWTFAITGDLFYFSLIMSSTLWLDNALGDGTKTTLVILVGMMVIPSVIRRLRGRWKSVQCVLF